MLPGDHCYANDVALQVPGLHSYKNRRRSQETRGCCANLGHTHRLEEGRKMPDDGEQEGHLKNWR